MKATPQVTSGSCELYVQSRCVSSAAALINISCEWTATGKTFQRPFGVVDELHLPLPPFLRIAHL